MGPGSRVGHGTHGLGTVARVLDGGRKVMVRFDARPAVPFVVPVASLTLQGEPLPALVAEPAAPPVDEGPAPDEVDVATNRQALEALRLGVVPARAIHSVTVDRHAELDRIARLLETGSGMLVVSGGYGSGKTHLIELMESDALARGYLVARATFDPVEVPPSHPLRLYAALTRDLVYPDGGSGGLGPLFDRLGDSAEHIEGPRRHRWLSPALYAHHHAPPELAAATLDFVEGHTREDHMALLGRLQRRGYRGPGWLGLPDYRTFGQIMAYLLGGLAAWAHDARHAGLVLLLDEAEYIDRLESTSRAMAENVLRYLAMGTVAPDRLAFDGEEVYRGGHSAHRAVPARFSADQRLVAMCAFTPNPEIDRVLGGIFASSEQRIDLEPLHPTLFGVLAEKVFGLVKRAHPDLDPEATHRRLVTRALSRAFDSGEIATTRQAARMVVEFWDLYRLDPSRAVRALGPA